MAKHGPTSRSLPSTTSFITRGPQPWRCRAATCWRPSHHPAHLEGKGSRNARTRWPGPELLRIYTPMVRGRIATGRPGQLALCAVAQATGQVDQGVERRSHTGRSPVRVRGRTVMAREYFRERTTLARPSAGPLNDQHTDVEGGDGELHAVAVVAPANRDRHSACARCVNMDRQEQGVELRSDQQGP